MGSTSSKHTRKVAPEPYTSTRPEPYTSTRNNRRKNREERSKNLEERSKKREENKYKAQKNMGTIVGTQIKEIDRIIAGMNPESLSNTELQRSRNKTIAKYARRIPLTNAQRKNGITGKNVIGAYTALPGENLNNNTRNFFIRTLKKGRKG